MTKIVVDAQESGRETGSGLRNRDPIGQPRICPERILRVLLSSDRRSSFQEGVANVIRCRIRSPRHIGVHIERGGARPPLLRRECDFRRTPLVFDGILQL